MASKAASMVGLVLVALLAFIVWGYTPVATFEPVVYEAPPPEAWPTDRWARSTPEAQGMSSEVLLDMMAAYEQAAANDDEVYLDSMTVVRNGVVVAEIYPNPRFPPDQMHVIHSVTKSVVSGLVGIAIEQGHIESVDVRLVDVFADRTIAHLDERKQAITIADLLSMQTGLHSRDSSLYAYEGLFTMQRTDDWVQYALDLPMAAPPGQRFDYSNISTFLLSAIVMEATGQDPLDFAREHLIGFMAPSNFVFKSFFGFHDFHDSLGPNDLARLTTELSSAGFQGAFKVGLRPMATRFHYHQLIMYAATEEMAACGESVVRRTAAEELRHVARGIDAPANYTNGVRTDWHHLLLRGSWDPLPQSIQAYVQYGRPSRGACS